jgi:very-short-patch-repair endonuclease
VARLQSVGSDFATLAGFAWGEMQDISALRSLAKDIGARHARLNPWCQWQLGRQVAMTHGLGTLVQALEAGGLRAKDAVLAFDVAYARWLAPLLIDSREPLRRFSALEHSRLIEEFRALDSEIAKLASETIRARVGQMVPRKSDVDPAPGFGLLRREVQKKAGHVPVRRLVAEMGPALTRLTPCLLMSPHSVAQFFAAGQLKFDLVVFDEASQIAVWDAIGAIARGRNTIIVGDPKQMPPTNFFSRGADVDETAEEDLSSANVGDLESILDEGLAAGMHLHRLTGHYRSRHESLIAFSNHKYYGGELVTYPASVTQSSMVSLRRCHGAYQKGKERTNPEEAKAVVAEIVERLTDPSRSKQTIGVVTMNSEQQRLIRNLLDEERRRRPAMEHAFKDAAGEEIDMVYNLETVQGHERDVIMLSIGYGPTVAGARTMSMNFGPLNRTGGERRLNVAVTRAIREVLVFASFDADMIDLSRTSSQAVHDLKAYLDFAQRGPIALARQQTFSGGIDTYDSAFEERVAALLRAKGWTIQTQVGVSRFRIDLGVVHPDHVGRFLAGVECDGASFHSSPTARDRDRVRHAVLSSLGWQLVRLWSTDFFRDPETAIQRVHETLTGLLAADREASGQVNDATASEPDEGAEARLEAVEEVEEGATDFAGAEETTDAIEGGTEEPSTSAATQHDASQFYDDTYLKILRPICVELIDQVGPITFVHLAERIARAHGFQRTGSEIKKRVWSAVGRHRKSTRAPDGSSIFWPRDVEPTAYVPYRGDVVAGDARLWSAVPYVERLGLAVEIAGQYEPAARLSAMAQRIGIGRLGPKIRDELVELLESAAGLLES